MVYSVWSFIDSLLTSTEFWIQFGAVVAWLGAIVLIAEILNKTNLGGAEATRKVVHIGVGNVILLAWFLQIPSWFSITASAICSGIALLSYRYPILPGINSVGRKSLGTFFYALSIGILVAWFWRLEKYHYAALGILVMTWGDGFAALIGQRWGKHAYELWGIQKSWEGSLTMAGVSYVISSILLLGVQGNVWQSWLVPLAIALVSTGLEAFSKFGIDNLTVPLGSAATGFFLNEFWANAPTSDAIAYVVSLLSS
ncbi:MAG: diacylglycerol/polyprenol kinase family protein [Elainellaceae cyanobacterium]